MTSDQEFSERTGVMLSPWELKQIKEAVNELRASNPESVLADLVEEKIRVVEGDASPAQDPWIFN